MEGIPHYRPKQGPEIGSLYQFARTVREHHPDKALRPDRAPFDPTLYQDFPETELVAGPTGWQSIPAFVRFVVWLWAVSTVVSVAVGVLVGVLFVFGLAIGAGQ